MVHYSLNAMVVYSLIAMVVHSLIAMVVYDDVADKNCTNSVVIVVAVELVVAGAVLEAARAGSGRCLIHWLVASKVLCSL